MGVVRHQVGPRPIFIIHPPIQICHRPHYVEKLLVTEFQMGHFTCHQSVCMVQKMLSRKNGNFFSPISQIG